MRFYIFKDYILNDEMEVVMKITDLREEVLKNRKLKVSRWDVRRILFMLYIHGSPTLHHGKHVKGAL